MAKGQKKKKITKPFQKVPRGDFPRYLNTDYLGSIRLFQAAYSSNHQLFRRSCIPKHEPQFSISWCNPEAHYALKQTRRKYHLPAHQASRFKLHYMELLNQTRFFQPSKPLRFERRWTKYLMRYFLTEYPDLDHPRNTRKYIRLEYNKHLSSQTVLTQGAAMEMMATCHHRFQMSDLLLDLHARVFEFAEREKCLCRQSERYENKLQMQARDLRTLVRSLLGRAFHPTILTGQDITTGDLLFHEIVLYFNDRMQPIDVKASCHNCEPDDLVTF